MKLLRIFLAALMVASTAAPLTAAARTSVPIESFEGAIAPDANNKAPTPDEVKQAIFRAAAARDWTLKETGPGVLMATLDVRNKHTVVTEIRYSADKYALVYVQSNNMNESVNKEGKPVIHPYYNKWARELRDQIRVTLAGR